MPIASWRSCAGLVRMRAMALILARGGGGVEAGEKSVEESSQRLFAALPAGAQNMVLLMRALVGLPPLVLLDEVWSGMDEGMVCAARANFGGGGNLKDGHCGQSLGR